LQQAVTAFRTTTARRPKVCAIRVALAAIAACGCADGELAARPASSLNGCVSASFVTAAEPGSMRIAFGHQQGHNYEPRCARVSVGDVIRFEGPFATHPLVPGRIEAAIPVDDAASGGGPVREVLKGESAEFIADSPGRFGYYCDVHVAEGMMGAIEVVARASAVRENPR
jgi:plastocyanin